MATITAIWDRIEAGIRARDPDERRSLPASASFDDIRRVEDAIGLQLPQAVRESYLLHDGSNGIYICEQGFLMPLIGSEKGSLQDYSILNLWQRMLPVAKMMAQERSNPAGPIRDDWWHLRWVPLTENECGDYVCLDFGPAEGGRKGQVIDWWHEQGATRVLANSFTEWLAGLFAEPNEAAEQPRE
jgi:cell wall assembly regulator SMI1